jgi:hypothetical protein
MKRLVWALVLGMCMAGVAGIVTAEEPATAMLQYVPEGTEVVVGVDLALLSAHPRFDEVFQRVNTAKFEVNVANFEQMTGVNLMRDIQAFALVGELRDNGEGVLLIKGKWDMPGLVDLVAASPTYVAQEMSGSVIHTWFDEDEGKQKYAAFVREDLLAIGDCLEMVEGVVETSAGERPRLAVPALLNSEDVDSTRMPSAFIVALRPAQPDADFVKNPVLSRLQSVAALCEAQDDGLALTATARTFDGNSAPQLAHALRGLIAVGELLDNASTRSPWVVTTSHRGNEVTAQVNVPMTNVVAAAGMLGQMAKAE